jgi:hypothetical protein
MSRSTSRTGKQKKPSRAASQRVSYAQFPPAVETVEFPYAFVRPLHASRDAGELAHSVRGGDVWQEIVVPQCAEWDCERDFRPDGKRKPGPRRKYSCEEGELIELLRRFLGVTSYSAVIDWLCSDRGQRACELLGFNAPRQVPRRGDPPKFRQAHVPSASTLSDLRNDIGEERRLEVWQRFEDALRARYVAQTEGEGRVLHLDGVNIRTNRQCPKYHPKTGQLVNPETVSVFDGGYQPLYGGGKKGGHGFNIASPPTCSSTSWFA